MTEVLWPDQVRLSSHRLWTASKDLLQEDAKWYIVHRLSHRVRSIGPFSRNNKEPVLAGCQKQNETTFGVAVGNSSSTLTRKPLETVTLRRCLTDPKYPANGLPLHRSSSDLDPRLHSQELNSHSDPVRPSVRPLRQQAVGGARKRQSYRKRQINAANRELEALILSNRRWNWNQIADDDRRTCRTLSSERTASGVKGVKHSDVVTRVSKHAHNFSADCSGEVIVPSWRVVETKRRYVIEQTEDLDDEVFKLRHQKLELNEKRRKRWDDQRLRGLQLLERSHNRKDQFAINSHTEPISSSAYNNVDMTTVKVIEAEPVIAFGHFIACIPPKEFSLPKFICQQSNSVKLKRPKSSSY